MKIGILQTGIAPEELVVSHGEYPKIFENFLGGRGFTFQAFNILQHEFPTSIDDADGWLITGSKHGVYEKHDWIAPLEDFIRAIYAAGNPLVGVCFGHQLIAQALGGKVEKYHDGWSVGHAEYEMEDCENPVLLNAWHQDQVVELPKDARVIGSSAFCKYAMLAYGDKVLTVQPHPEFSDHFIEGLIKYRAVGVVPDDLLQVATARMGTPKQAKRIADLFTDIFKQAMA